MEIDRPVSDEAQGVESEAVQTPVAHDEGKAQSEAPIESVEECIKGDLYCVSLGRDKVLDAGWIELEGPVRFQDVNWHNLP